MPLAFDVSATASTSGSSWTWTHPGAATPMNYLGLVGLAWYNATVVTVSSITWGGQAMTAIRQEVAASLGASLFGIINPPAGSQTIVATLSGGVGFSSSAGSLSLTGADQVTGWHNPNSLPETGSGQLSASLIITSALNEFTVTVAAGNLSDSFTSNQVRRWTQAANMSGAGDTGVGAATVTHTWSSTGTPQWTIVGASIIPAASTTLGLQTPIIHQPPLIIQTW
jgi:hypothetical protein